MSALIHPDIMTYVRYLPDMLLCLKKNIPVDKNNCESCQTRH